MIDATNIREIYDYDPLTGIFRWAIRPSSCVLPGTIAGYGHPEDWLIVFRRKNYSARRLAWLYMTGKWPVTDVRNRNGDVHDFRWANLELTNQRERSRRGARVSSNTGHRHIYKVKNRFMLQINRMGRVALQKSFKTVDGAIAARDEFLKAERTPK